MYRVSYENLPWITVFWQDHFCCSTCVETKVFLGKRSKPFLHLSNQWSIMQYLNFVSKKIFFSAVSIYGLLFLRGFWRLLINCFNSKRSNFSFITVYFFTSVIFTFFTSTENPFIYFKNQFSFVFSQPIISEYANKFSRKGIPSTRFAKYLV